MMYDLRVAIHDCVRMNSTPNTKQRQFNSKDPLHRLGIELEE